MVDRFTFRHAGWYATYSAQLLFLAAFYVVVARLGLRLDAVSGFATLVWPPTGLALAAVLLYGPRMWPGIALGAVVANAWHGAPLPVACGIAVGNTLEAVLGAYALTRLPGFRKTLDRLPDVLGLIVVGAVASTAVSATIGVTSLYLGGLTPASQFRATWIAWWLGDAIGALVVAPILLSWITGPWVRIAPKRLAEAAALGLTLWGASTYLLGADPTSASPLRQPTTLMPLLIWAALRFGTRGVTAATLLVSAVAVWSTALGRGPFVRGELHDSLSMLQGFMAVVAVTFLVLSAVTAERAHVEQERTILYHRERLARAHAEDLTRLRQEARLPSDDA